MEWVETTGRTVEDAKEAALDQLGVDESDAEFEVVEEARAGLFGRLRGEARVRARVRPTAPRAKDDRRDRRRRARANGEGRGRRIRRHWSGTDAVAAGRVPNRPRRRPAAPGPRSTAADATPSAVASKPSSGTPATECQPTGDRTAGTRTDRSATAAAIGGGAARRCQRQRRRFPPAQDSKYCGAITRRPDDRDGRTRHGRTARPERHAMEHASRDQGQEGGNVEVALDEQGQIAQDFLTQLVAEFGVDAAVDVVRPDDETVDLQLEGSDLGLLIGPEGHDSPGPAGSDPDGRASPTGAGNGRIHVDVGGYRQKRTRGPGPLRPAGGDAPSRPAEPVPSWSR